MGKPIPNFFPVSGPYPQIAYLLWWDYNLHPIDGGWYEGNESADPIHWMCLGDNTNQTRVLVKFDIDELLT